MTRVSSYADRIKSDNNGELPVPGTPRGSATRAKILAASEAVFGDVGYDQASIVAITQRAGVAQGSFYTYFPSKHAVFVELIREAMADIRRLISTKVSTAPAPLTRARVDRLGSQASFEFFLDRPGIFSIVHEARVVAPEMYGWWTTTFAAAYVENFERLSGPAPRDFDVEGFAYAVMGITDMLILRWVIREKRLPPANVIDQIFDILGNGLDAIVDGSQVHVGT